MQNDETIKEIHKYAVLYKTHIKSIETIKRKIKELEEQLINQ